MALGNDAIAAGMDITPDNTTDANTIGSEITKSRDYIAQFFAAAKSYADGLFGAISLSWSSITGKPSTFPPSSHSLSSHSGSLGADRLSSGVMSGNFGATGNIEMNGNLRSSGARNNAVSSWLNVGVDPSGYIGQTSSARRFKQDIEDFDAGGNVDAIRPRRFRWRKWKDRGFDHGLIAEELEEAGFGWLVTRDENGDPFGVRYELLAIALIPEIQALRARVAKLEGAD